MMIFLPLISARTEGCLPNEVPIGVVRPRPRPPWPSWSTPCVSSTMATPHAHYLFLTAAFLLVHGWFVNMRSRWFVRRQREALSPPSPVVEAVDQSYLFVVKLVDNIMHSVNHPLAGAADWCKYTPTLLALRQVSRGGRQAVEEDGPANGHMTATARYIGAIGRHLQLRRIFERAAAEQQTRRPQVKVLVATDKCSTNEARMAYFTCQLPPRAGEFSDNDVQLALDFLQRQ